MTVGLELFGGAVDATLVSTANSTISFASGGAADFDTGQSFKNDTSLRIPGTAGTASYVRWDALAGTTQISVSVYCRFASVNPSGANTVINIRDSAGAGLTGLVIRTTGRLAAINAAGAVITANGGTDIAAHLLTANNWYRVDFMCEISATVGRVQYRIIDVQGGDSDTPITAAYDSGASQNLGSTNIDRFYLGSVGAVTSNGDYNFGIVRWDTGSTAFFNQYTDAIRSVNSQQGTSLSAAANLLLPGGAASGDLVMYLISCDATGGTAISAAGGSGGGSAWTDISSSVITGNVLEGRVFARVLTGTTGDNICNPDGAAQDYTAIGVCIFGTKHPYTSSTNLATALADAITNDASSTAANPPNANPGTSLTYTWLTWATIDKNVSGDTISAPPTNYINLFGSNSAAAGTSTFARLAYRKLSAASEDPGTFTNTARPWIAYTVAVAAFVEITVPTATLTLTPVAPSISVTGSALVLLTPADASNTDLTDGETFTWDHPGTQTEYAFKRRVAGGAWRWWNGSTWQSTETFISSATEAVTFSAGQW